MRVLEEARVDGLRGWVAYLLVYRHLGVFYRDIGYGGMTEPGVVHLAILSNTGRRESMSREERKRRQKWRQ